MAKKKNSIIEEMESADIMSVLSDGGQTSLFNKNDLIDYSYGTGVSVIDYAYGYQINIRNPETGEIIKKRSCIGLQAGTLNVITGSTQSFKTTVGMQISANIAYRYNGNVIHYDAENRLVTQRVKTITKLPDVWFDSDFPRYKMKKGAIGYDTLKQDIAEIWKMKMKNRDKLLRDTGVTDSQNKPIFLMPPTIIFLDSISDVIDKEYDICNKKTIDGIEDQRSNMAGAQTAKSLKNLLGDILPMLITGNILFICIAHKSVNISTNAFAGPKKQFQYGAHDEKMAGGKALEYNLSALINLSAETSADSRYHMSSDGFEGNTILFEPTKSSTNESGNSKTGFGFRIVIDKRVDGVDNLRTLTLFLNERGRLKGNKACFRVIDKNGEPITDKFTWKTIHEDFAENKDTLAKFMSVAKVELEKLISKAPDNSGKIKPFDIDEYLIDSDNMEE